MRKHWFEACTSSGEEIRDQKPTFSEFYQLAFGQRVLRQLSFARLNNGPALSLVYEPGLDKIIKAFLSETLVGRIDSFNDLIHASQARKNLTHIDHDAVLALLKEAITKLD
ncbi:hypothetical protein CVT25_004062 [Psilocybe cyanescens]|uniref:Uncharacterized protein n=1 Tax=Psilocybe cyanescens TaxID=93625 RepID=A0A409XQ09_PSICY|nr:hypothetical protein CVT25_004062 [Psilocybe cyanescens]